MTTSPANATAKGDPAICGARNYRAFGMIIRSEIPLPELTPAHADEIPDVDVVLVAGDQPLPALEDGLVAQFAENGDHYFAWPDVATFQFRGTDRIEVQPYPGAPMTYLAFPLLGPIFGLLLHARGLLVLHASAIEIDGRGAIFVGDKLAGKSTTAAAFLRGGHRLLTDDLLAVDLSGKAGPRILPAFGQLKLSDEAASTIQIQRAEALPLVFPGLEKRQHRLGGPFQHDAIPPHRLYVLDRGGEEAVSDQLTGADALRAVMRFSYIVRFGKAALPGKAEADHMQRCARLARAVGVARLGVPADLGRLDETVALVRAEMKDL